MTPQPIASVREQKTALLNILVTAIALALAVNLLAAYLSMLCSHTPYVLLFLSLASLLAALLLFRRFLRSQSTIVVRLRGALAFKTQGHEIKCISIMGYAFNDHMCEYLRAFLSENKAYGELFFSPKRSEVKKSDRFDPDELDHHCIINSVLEFAILRKLDLHLNSYFVENEIGSERITTITREHFPPAVLKNRVLDVITRDMKEREAFLGRHEHPQQGIVCMAPGKDGALYERLDIELPPKSTIERDTRGHLILSNSAFDITIWPQFEGFNTALAPELIPPHTGHFIPYLIGLKLVIHLKPSTFLSLESIELYEWLDSFIEELTAYISTDALERRIDPDLVRLIKSQQGRELRGGAS